MVVGTPISINRNSPSGTPGLNEANPGNKDTSVTSGLGNIANSGVAGSAAAQKQILTNAQQAQAQNINLAKAGDRQALNQLFNSPDLATNKEAQNAIAYSVLNNNGITPNQNLIDQLIRGTLQGRNAKGGIDYGIDLSENLGISDSVSNLKKANLGLGDVLGFSDTVSAQKNLGKANSLLSNATQQSNATQDRINQLQSQLAGYNKAIAETTPADTEKPGFNPLAFRDLVLARDSVQNELAGLANQSSFFGSLSSLAGANAKVQESKSLQAASGLVTSKSTLNNPLGAILPQAFGQQQAKHFDLNLSESIGIREPPKKNEELLQGIGGPSQDYFGSPSEATAGFFGSPTPSYGKTTSLPPTKQSPLEATLDLPAGILSPNESAEEKAADQRAISIVTNRVKENANYGLGDLTVTFDNGLQKTYNTKTAVKDILSDYQAQKKPIPVEKGYTGTPGITIPGFKFADQSYESGTKAVSLTPIQKQNAQAQDKALTDLAHKVQTNNDVLDVYSGGKLIGTTSGTRTKYDLVKALSQYGDVSYQERNPAQQAKQSDFLNKSLELSPTLDIFSQGVKVGTIKNNAQTKDVLASLPSGTTYGPTSSPDILAQNKANVASIRNTVQNNLSSGNPIDVLNPDTGKLLGSFSGPRAFHDILELQQTTPSIQLRTFTNVSDNKKVPDHVSPATYADLVDLGKIKLESPEDYAKYYGSVAIRTAAEFPAAIYNYGAKQIKPDLAIPYESSPTFYSNLFSFVPAGAKKLENLGVHKALGLPSDVSGDTRKPSDIFQQGILAASKELKTDPLKVLSESPGAVGEFVLFGLGAKGVAKVGEAGATKLNNIEAQKEVNKFVNKLQIPKDVTIEYKPPPNEITGKVGPDEVNNGFFSDTIKTENIVPKVSLERQLETPEFFAEKVKGDNTLFRITTPSTSEEEPNVFVRYLGKNAKGEPDFNLIVDTTKLNPRPSSTSIAGQIGAAEQDMFGVPIKNKGVTPTTGVAVGPASAESLRNFQSAFLVPDYLKPLGTRETFTASQLKGREQDFAYYILGKTRNDRIAAPMIPIDEMLLTQSKSFGTVGTETGQARSLYDLLGPKTRVGVKARRIASKVTYPLRGLFSEDVFNPVESSYENIGGETIKTAKRTSTFDIDVNKFLNPETEQAIANRPYKTKGISFTKGKFSLADNPLGEIGGGEQVSEEVKNRYPLMSGLTKEKATDIEKALGPKEEKGNTRTISSYPYTSNRRRNDEITFEVIRYPPGSKFKTGLSLEEHAGQVSGLSSLSSFGGGSRTKGGQGSILTNAFDLENIIGTRTGQNNKKDILQRWNQITTPLNKQGTRNSLDTLTKQISITGLTNDTIQGQKGKLDLVQIQSQKTKGLLTDFVPPTEVPPTQRPPPPELIFGGQWPRLYGLTSPKKKHGSRNIGSFFTYTVNPNKPGDIADVGYKTGKVVGLKPVKLRFGGESKLDNLLGGTSGYSKRKKKKDFDISF